ncbi:MAG: hypothetical protein TR69_WS6001000376 [candidate division WS6 bacterium OLB20]|uniref:Uncharacterized protein n=1 Tax=candidate division WS6 bacterium OLB20 TaxID=1617426 RepID=A0A136LXK2_9BACT|nr:MAG: hypothetical protein TR69_WS6001000376 [candidate division WS6 bacterium OLB20]
MQLSCLTLHKSSEEELFNKGNGYYPDRYKYKQRNPAVYKTDLTICKQTGGTDKQGDKYTCY